MIVSDYPTHLERYYAWIYERQSIWYKRYMLRAPQPWTDDPILQKIRFTNSYRELDRGTLYAKAVVIAPYAFDCLNSLFMRTLTYRLFNRVSTYDKVFRVHGYFTSRDYVPDWGKLLADLSELHRSEPIFTRAHVIPTFGSRKADNESKVSQVIELLKAVYERRTQIVRHVLIDPGDNFELAHKHLQEISYLGDFLAFEILSDLAYTTWVDFNEDTWANAGPGAKEGMALVYPPQQHRGKSYLELMRETQKNQNIYFQSLGLPLWLVAGPKTHSPWLTLRNIEGGFCEYYKYNTCLEGKLANRLPFDVGQGYAWKQDVEPILSGVHVGES